MTTIFWGIIILMTMAAIVPLLIVRKKQNVLPVSAKITITVLIAALAPIFYWSFGSAKDVLHYWSMKKQVNAVRVALSTIKNPKQLIHQLETFLTVHPNQSQAWYLLGQLYYAQHAYKPALIALTKAHKQAPQHLTYAVSLAEADFFYHQQHLTPAMKTLLFNVIQKDYNNVGALNLLAIDDYLAGRYRSAIRYWEQLLSLFPAGSKDQQFLLIMIANAQKKELTSRPH